MSEKTFLVDLTETELKFIVNALHEVNISAKDARFVADFQTKLIGLLMPKPAGPSEAVPEIETAVV